MSTLSGPIGVAYARFASIKYQLRLEKAGMKSSGGALRPRLANEFGLSPRDPHALYIDYCVAQMDDLLEARREELLAEEALVS